MKFPTPIKPMLIMLGLGTVFAICVITLTNGITSGIEEENSMKRHVNKKVVVDGDTLTVVSTSIWTGDYTLSNGLEVDEKFIKQNEVK